MSPSHSFTPSTITVPAGLAFRLIYRNDDSGAEHDVAIYDHNGGREIAVTTNIVGPGAETEIVMPALTAGIYFVQCDIHPFMTASLAVRESFASADSDASIKRR
jgi:plastocyanin